MGEISDAFPSPTRVTTGVACLMGPFLVLPNWQPHASKYFQAFGKEEVSSGDSRGLEVITASATDLLCDLGGSLPFSVPDFPICNRCGVMIPISVRG